VAIEGKRSPLPAAERGRIRIRAARRRRHGLSLGGCSGSAARNRQPHRRRRPLARRPQLGQRVCGLWRRLLGAGAGRQLRRQRFWPARPRRQRQRMGRRLLA
jgi:hypothetical protein